MAQLLVIPPAQLAADTLQALLEEYASRDGTDYGHREHSLEAKVLSINAQLNNGELTLVFDLDSEQYDLCDRQSLEALNLQ